MTSLSPLSQPHVRLIAVFVALAASSAATAQDAVLRVEDRPVVQRGFLPDSSPRSIAVGLPGGVSFCFDVAECRLRYAWSGGFLNMKPTWHDRGAAPPELGGAKFFTAPDTMTLRAGDRGAPPRVKFLGYALIKGLPEFRYQVDGADVKQRITAVEGGGLCCTFEVNDTAAPVTFLPPANAKVTAAGREVTPGADGLVTIPRGAPAVFEVRLPGPASATTNPK